MIAWKIGGEQGEGIDSTGDVLATVANRMGYFVYGYKSFSSRIKGGHTTYKVRIANRRVEAAAEATDILVALNQETINKHVWELDGGLLLADSAFSPTLPEGLKAHLIALPLTEIAKQHGSVVMRNMVSVGASAALLNLPADPFLEYVESKFSRKGTEIVKANQEALLDGFNRVHDQFQGVSQLKLDAPVPGDRVVITGNDAIALGAVAGGCRIMCGYPITPATDIMEALSKWLPMVGGTVVQMEDELGSITACIGAGYAGARAMTATSGPGFSLMQEGIGLASMAEIPVVIVDTQRSGPSTGMPTKQEQSDLMAIINGGHGEGPRVVLAPSSVEEAFEDGWQAFNIADQLQTPVLIATDLSLSLWSQSVDRAKLNGPRVPIERGPIVSSDDLTALGENVFLRYQMTDDGVSPRSLPGTQNGQFLATGVEHQPNGKVSEDPANRTRMMEKRLTKIQRVHALRDGVRYEGPDDADLVLLAIGATVGAIKEARDILTTERHRVAASWLRTLSPFPIAQFERLFRRARQILIVEQNATGQVAHLMRQAGVYDPKRCHSLLKYDGVQFFPSEIVEAARPLLESFAEVKS
ncbi:2-oxoacid:acceptor oxidoreductase subunit alpha [Sulfobacillus harzensis]|uniref:2-oxoacid:acceptor oxidoreductase subunit alpha n=1 Tax=Sulfobacillus harzensis TaxID=2729629 RepID=A0A7Y0L1H7_9FIRM|nr:2-oxoacid:acceptor oxidoreductase subunit alpha [Sulfobacillus harzensis]NMP21292.1 2-oxoacid:acceptor oxidoreductase subunit alpha [Sulfobacillus harzensis]